MSLINYKKERLQAFNTVKILQMKKIQILFIGLLILSACNKNNKGCAYEEPCVESCDMLEDFEGDPVGTPGNWLGINDHGITILEAPNGNNQYIETVDDSGASWMYNTEDFPTNLPEAGCELHYDVQYLAGSHNGLTSDNSLVIFQGSSPSSATLIASFVLNATHLITSGAGWTNIEVPLQTATGNSLPSNSFGEWRIAGSNTPSAADIANFNTLIQNISGVAFFLDEGSNPAEKWYYDNFCFKQCCNN